MNKLLILGGIILAGVITCLSCDDYEPKQMEQLTGEYVGRLMLSKGTDTLFIQENVVIRMTVDEANYFDYEMLNYEEEATLELPTRVKLLAHENYDGIRYQNKVRFKYKGTPYTTNLYVSERGDTVMMDLQIQDPKPFTTVSFRCDL